MGGDAIEAYDGGNAGLVEVELVAGLVVVGSNGAEAAFDGDGGERFELCGRSD